MEIVFWGPITPKGEPSIGGYAAANRKSIDALAGYGVDVVEIAKKKNFCLLFQPFRLLRFRGRKDVVVHIATPLGGLLMVPVLMVLRFARFLSLPTLLDIRAGIFIQRYNNYNSVLKWLTKRMLYAASAISVEGLAYQRQIAETFAYSANIHYFPNVVDCANIGCKPKPVNCINIFYFGRITRTKGVDVMLNVIGLLGEGFRLYLAGPVADDISMNDLCRERVSYLGLLKDVELRKQMERMHFFIFPTRHFGEGQSNSLIEAMAEGLIPITSNYGFCREVVADCGVVLPVASVALDYVEAIRSIDAERMKVLQQRCVEHIAECHNLDKEIRKIIELYSSMQRLNNESTASYIENGV